MKNFRFPCNIALNKSDKYSVGHFSIKFETKRLNERGLNISMENTINGNKPEMTYSYLQPDDSLKRNQFPPPDVYKFR